ncbi:MAG: hypothetical protein JO264_19760 [Acidisphaera sp.]|nr:hypothetical protein [Acidisphaera sp.]
MRALQIATVVMGVLIVAGTIGLFVVIGHRITARGTPGATLVLDEPAGTRIAAASISGDRLVVQLAGGGPDRVVLLDPHALRVLGHVSLAR